MDHVVYLDYKARDLENLKDKKKTMIIRGAMGRKIPYGRINVSDILYFIENKGDGLIKAKAVVKDVFNSDKLEKEESLVLINQNKVKLLPDSGMMKRFGGKRYLILITIESFEEISPFKIDKSNFSNMDDWLPVVNIENVRIQ